MLANLWHIMNDVSNELTRAMRLHNPQRSAHESYAVIQEEVDEFWEIVKRKAEHRDRKQMKQELVQIAAMAMRAIHDLGLDDKIDYPHDGDHAGGGPVG